MYKVNETSTDKPLFVIQSYIFYEYIVHSHFSICNILFPVTINIRTSTLGGLFSYFYPIFTFLEDCLNLKQKILQHKSIKANKN